MKSYTQEIRSFEETAAPTGFSLLWDETDKKYGYINNYTGEVTQGNFNIRRLKLKPTLEYPSSYKADKVEKNHKDISNLNSRTKGMDLELI